MQKSSTRNIRQNIQKNIQKKFRVLGVDPGLNITGYGVIAVCGSNDPEVIEAGTFRMNPTASLGKRVSQIYTDLSELIAEVSPDIIAVEQLYAHYKHPRTSILMGHARGVILLAAEQAGLTVHSIAATKVKKNLTGNGMATKRQIQLAIQSVCKLAEIPEPADVADAIAIALCAGRFAK